MTNPDAIVTTVINDVKKEAKDLTQKKPTSFGVLFQRLFYSRELLYRKETGAIFYTCRYFSSSALYPVFTPYRCIKIFYKNNGIKFQ